MNINDQFPSKYLKASDIPEDENLIVTMVNVTVEKLGQEEDQDVRPVLYFEETEKGLVLNKTNSETITGLYGPETNDWRGRKIALYATEVAFKGKQTMAIRIRLKKPKDAPAATPAPASPNSTDDNDPFAEED